MRGDVTSASSAGYLRPPKKPSRSGLAPETSNFVPFKRSHARPSLRHVEHAPFPHQSVGILYGRSVLCALFCCPRFPCRIRPFPPTPPSPWLVCKCPPRGLTERCRARSDGRCPPSPPFSTPTSSTSAPQPFSPDPKFVLRKVCFFLREEIPRAGAGGRCPPPFICLRFSLSARAPSAWRTDAAG